MRKFKIFKEYKSLEVQTTPSVRNIIKLSMKGCISLYKRVDSDFAIDVWSGILIKPFYKQLLQYNYIESDYKELKEIASTFLDYYIYTYNLCDGDEKLGLITNEYNFLSELERYIDKRFYL